MLDRNSTHARYEYLEGELRMLAGGSAYHSAIIVRLSSFFERHLENSPCWVYNSDMKLQLSESLHVYPDIMISCNPQDQEPDRTVIHNPSLIVEVLSPSTEAVDRREKLLYYQESPTVQDYLMVDSQSVRIEMYHREADGWKLSIYGPDDTIHIKNFDIRFSINAIYRGMALAGKRQNSSKYNQRKQ